MSTIPSMPRGTGQSLACYRILGSLAFALLVAWAGSGPQLAPQGAPDFDSLDIEALLALTRQAGARATEQLLAPPADWQQKYAEVLTVPDAKVVRLLARGLHDVPPKRGGGAYYSFATDDHDYDREPDLSYEQGSLGTGFYGGSTGQVLDLGSVPLAGFRPQAPPSEFDPAVARQCEVLWSFASQDSRPDEALCEALGTEDIGRAPALAGHSYLLRAILPGEHDLLAAFTVMEATPQSVVLVGHVLKTWSTAGRRSETRPRRDFSSAGAPDWLLQCDGERLAALATGLLRRSEARLFAVPSAWANEPVGVIRGADAGVMQLLPNGEYDWLAEAPGGNSYYSFVTHGHSIDEEPDLQWKLKHFFTGISNPGAGAFLDLGDVDLATVDLAHPPVDLTLSQLRRWDELQADDAGERVCTVCGQVPAIVDHTYLLRSIHTGKHDLLVAFRPVAEDVHGMTIAWHVLRRYAP
ncbi:MAG TPA: hypothetical protein VFY71_11350 [Planctomycetota bacterium]|nr:hypothetical protein [Planctomycetota bacterium]